MEENENIERLCFVRKGEDGMEIEIVGNNTTLMAMIHSALLTHVEVRKVLFPVLMALVKDEKFLDIAMQDILDQLTGEDDQIIDTE